MKRAVNSIVAICLIGIACYCLIQVKESRQQLKSMSTAHQELTQELEKQTQNYEQAKEKLLSEQEKVKVTEKKLKQISNKLAKTEDSLTEAEKKIANYETQSTMTPQPTNNNQEVVETTSALSQPASKQVSDPVAERDAFAASFRAEHGREPSSGEVQMYWLRKQGLIE